jgi:hypothetical protein
MSAVNGDLSGLVEVLNFHPTWAVADEIKQRRAAGRVWVGRIGPHGPRLNDRLREKATKYKHVVERARIPYVIALFSEFTANVDLDEVRQSLSEENSLSLEYPTISGILFFEERTGRYQFSYTPSPSAAMAIALPSGTF